MRNLRAPILAWLVLTGLYWILRIPARELELCYLDDSEILYHLLVILKGGVPYLDSSSHHFLGYLLPYLLTVKIFGFSSALVEQTSLLVTPLVGLLVYLSARVFCRPSVAFFAAVLCLAARQPFVLGIPIQFTLNLPIMASLAAALYSTRRQQNWLIYLSALFAGLALCFDQRALVAITVPVCALLVSQRVSSSQVLKCVLCYVTPFIATLSWLIYRGAWQEFYLQTVIFPSQYRVASQSLTQLLELWIKNHLVLIDSSPLLVTFAAIGGFLVLRVLLRGVQSINRSALLIFLAAAPFCILMPISAGRTFDYYTIPWLPWLALASAIGASLIPFSSPGKKLYAAILVAPVIISLTHVAFYKPSPEFVACIDDGAPEVVAYLAQQGINDRELLVWDYRLDLFVKLGIVGAIADANPIMIRPDRGVRGALERQQHVLPEHEQRFYSTLEKIPPRFIVTAKDFDPELTSAADIRLREMIDEQYTERLSISRAGFMGKVVDWRVYEQQDKTETD